MEGFRDVPTASRILASGGDGWNRNPIRFRVSEELLRDAADISGFINRATWRYFRPWDGPDPAAIGPIELFPRIASIQRRGHTALVWLRSWRTLRLHRCYHDEDCWH